MQQMVETVDPVKNGDTIALVVVVDRLTKLAG